MSMIWNFGTPINPVFLTLPYLTKAAKLVTQDERLEAVADKKGDLILMCGNITNL